MATNRKFEEMLEKLVNEDRAGAEELFHEIVVEKSRDIYEGLLESELEDEDIEEATDETDEEVEESEKDDDEAVEEASDEDEDSELDEMGDPADDMIDDVAAMGDEGDDEEADMDDMGGDEGEEAGEGELEDRVEDLEDALSELEKEFQDMLASAGGEEPAADDMGDMDMGGEAEDDMEADEGFEFESADKDGEKLDEYTIKVADAKGEDNKAKSVVAGKNDMGGSAGNIAQGSAEEKGGKADKATVEDAGNVNKPGNKKAPAYSKAKA